MKFIDNNNLEQLSNHLSEKKIGSFFINGRLELYVNSHSSKDQHDELSNSSNIGSEPFDPNQFIRNKPRSNSLGDYRPKVGRKRTGSLGDLDDISSKQLLCLLISTLNSFYFDYDFSNAKPESFIYKELNEVIREVNSRLAEISLSENSFHSLLWTSINEIIDLNHSEIFSYQSDLEDDDPFNDGALWCFNYFIFNRQKGWIIYFTCASTK